MAIAEWSNRLFPMATNRVTELILKALHDQKKDMKEVSLAIGKNHAYLQQFLSRGIPAKLSEDVRVDLGRELSLNPDDLRGAPAKVKLPIGKGGRSRAPIATATDDASAFPLRSTDVEPRVSGPRNLPVYGAAAGGDGTMILDNDPIEYVLMPGALTGVRGAFAVYVVNDSMSPKYEQGERVHIHPGRPIRPPNDAIFLRTEADGTQYALIKRLVKVTDKAWRVQQFNPPKIFDLSRSVWQRALRIVGTEGAD